MVWGLLPALVSFVLLVTAVAAVAGVAPRVAVWMTPFGRLWSPEVVEVVRAAIAFAMIAGCLALSVVLFTALTLMIGSPIYERISSAVEQANGGIPGEVTRSTVRQIGAGIVDGLRMLLTSAGLGIGVAVVGLVPILGTVAGAVLAAVGGSRIITTELTATPCDARGMTLGERRLLLRKNRWRVLGFGLCTYLLFLVPGASVLLMPAAVAGATMLAREVLGEPVG